MSMNERDAPLEPVQWLFEEMSPTSQNKQIFGGCYCIQFYMQGNFPGAYVLINNTFRVYPSVTIVPIVLTCQPGQLDTTVYNIAFVNPGGYNLVLHIARLTPRLFHKAKNLMK